MFTINPFTFSTIYRRRFIDPDANPRRKEKQKEPVIRLFHFTRPGSVAVICRDGLLMGDVPVRWQDEPSDECFNNAVWLTNRNVPSEQTWGQPEKRLVRMTVEIEAIDLNLWRWRDLARHLGVAPDWYQELNRRGGGFADKWWVYCNEPIAPDRIVRVDRLDVQLCV